MDGRTSPPWGAFSAVVVIAGCNAVAVRVSNQELRPFWGAALRFGLAAILFLAITWWRKSTYPRGRTLAGAMLYGALSVGAAYALLYYGLVHVQAGFASVVLGLVPLATLLLAAMQRLERMRWHSVIGATLAALGMAVIVRDHLGGDAPLAPVLALLAAPFAIAQSSIVAKRLPSVDPFAMNAVAMVTGSLLLLVLSVVQGEAWQLPRETTTRVVVAYLVIVGSVGLFGLYLYVLRRWTVTGASYQFVLSPLAAVLVAFVLLRESVSWEFAAGSVIVLAGVYVGALRRTRSG